MPLQMVLVPVTFTVGPAGGLLMVKLLEKSHSTVPFLSNPVTQKQYVPGAKPVTCEVQLVALNETVDQLADELLQSLFAEIDTSTLGTLLKLAMFNVPVGVVQVGWVTLYVDLLQPSTVKV